MAESLLHYSCYACKNLPLGEVFVCENRHLYCADCADEADEICRCNADLKSRTHLLKAAVQKDGNNCRHKNCTFKLKAGSTHESECKYRPSECIGHKLKVFGCSWNGTFNNMSEHLKQKHMNYMKFYEHADEGVLPFDEKHLKSTIGHISAHNNSFILYYHPNKQTQTVNVIVLLCGTKINAKNYLYEFEIISMKDANLKIKFMNECVSDTDKIWEIISSGDCASLTFNVVRHYARAFVLQFRVRILKKNKIVQGTSSAKKT